MSSEGDLTLLLETNDPVELASVRSLLEGHDLQYVVQGELHSAMVAGFMGNPAVVPRVLVANRDLARALALLQAEPDTKAQPAAGAAPLEGAECPVHLKPAIAACGRCGTFLCGECKALGQPPLCEDCDVSESFQRRPKDAKASFYKKAVVWGLLGFALLSLLCGGL